MKSRYPFILIAVIFVFCMTTLMASMVEARRGGGGFSRSGPAASGGFSSRPARQTPQQETRQKQPRDQDIGRDDLQERSDEIREKHQEYREDAREDRNDRHHYSGDVAFLTYAPCSTTVVVDGSTYYYCSSTWYLRGYIVTSAPAGY